MLSAAGYSRVSIGGGISAGCADEIDEVPGELDAPA
jgi:hypothetical protein